MKVYKIAKGWAIFIYITAPLLIGIFGWLLVMPFIPGMKDMPIIFHLIFTPISLGMIALICVGIRDTAKSRVIVDDQRISLRSMFSNRELLFDDIRGYRVHENYIFVEPNAEGKKKIKISTYFEKTDEILEWLSSNYPNLDYLTIEQEQRAILESEGFGRTTVEREEKLNRARWTSKILNWLGGIVAVWTLFVAQPYEYSILTSIAIPIASIVVLKMYGGLIRIDDRRDSAYPTIFWAVLSTSLGLFLRALLDFNIFEYKNIWLPSGLITLFFIAFLLIGNSEFKFKMARDYFAILSLSLFLFGYSYGSVVVLNCYYDNSVSDQFKSKILSKRIDSGNTTTYYFELEPWGNQTEIDEVSVSKNLFDQLEANDTARIYFNKGLFKIPWFEISE